MVRSVHAGRAVLVAQAADLDGAFLVAAFSLVILVSDISDHLDPGRAAQATAQATAQAVRDRADIISTVLEVRAGGWGAMVENLKSWLVIQGASLMVFVVPTVGLMMTGLGLFKSGFLAGRSSGRVYVAALMGGVAITVAYGVTDWIILGSGDPLATVYVANAVLDMLAPFVTLAWVSLLILMTRFGLGGLTRRLVPVGRMAFTNYLSQSLIMASLFYMPWGPVLYGRVEPAALWGFVGAVWTLQLIWSPLWLSRFEMGPLEWVWRSLTYGRRVALVKRA